MKKLLSIALAAGLSIQLAACGNKDGADTASSEEYAYKAVSAEITEDFSGELSGWSEGFDLYDERIYFMSENTTDPEKPYIEYYLNSADVSNLTGENFKSVQLSSKENAMVFAPKFGADGVCRFIYSEGESYFLKSVDTEGGELSSADITKAVTEKFPDGFYPLYCAYDEAGNICFAGRSDFIVLDPQGGLVCAYSDAEGRSFDTLCTDRSGKLYGYLWRGDGYALCGIDTVAGKLEAEVETPFNVYGNTFSSGGGEYDFYVNDGTSLLGWNIGGEPVTLLNWVQAGVSTLEVRAVFYSGNETFITAGLSYPHENPKFFLLKKELVNRGAKTEILVAGTENGITSYVENAAIKFNNVNDKYYVTIKKYPYDQADKLNLDLTSGQVPDVLFTDSYTPTDAYIAKGIFADLYEFIDSDPELKREDFLPNLLTACETDGKLYRFTDKFSIYTVLGKTSIFGDKQGITVDELNTIMESMPSGTELFPGFTKRTILQYALQLSGDEFIDYKKGVCNFTSDSFIKMMEFANSFISDIDSESYFDDSFWERYDTMFADESGLLMVAFLTDYADVFAFERINFDDKVTAVGFPCENRVGTSFAVDSGFSVSAKSKNTDGAWAFVRTLLLPEYQDLGDKLPARRDSLDKYAKTAMTYDPNRVVQPTVTMGDMMISLGRSDIDEPKQEDIDRFNAIIESANGLMSYNSNIMDIVDEEAATYFNGSKLAREAAELIQTRVKLYLDENT